MTKAAQKPRASKLASTFRMECGVRVDIQAAPARVWSLLTNAADFPRWNSTVTQLDGPIELGRKLALRVPISTRTFTPRVTLFEPPQQMVWSDGAWPMFKGVRTFQLREGEHGSTHFSMVEVLQGLMLPMIKGSLPDFGPAFEQYALDLKREAERAP